VKYMSKFIIYNTNKSQVFPDDRGRNEKSDDIDIYIDNAIEYYINNRKNRIIALVRADAPQVEGRDKANFYVEFKSDTSENLTKELANRLDEHSSNTGWKFHTDEPRWAMPWFVAESEVNNPADMEFSTVSILTVQDLIQDRKALDFGFNGYEDAATVLSYFSEKENTQASYAIASNGRKRIIKSAELVLQPGRHDNFELLSEGTRDQIAQRHDELKSDAKLFYQDETLELITSIQNAPELSPIQTLDDLHNLDTFVSNNNMSISDLELHSSSASDAITRINAVKNRRSIDTAPPVQFLDSNQREKTIADAQNLIREHKSELDQNLIDRVLSSLESHLTELEQEPPGSVINEVSEIEDQLANGQPRAYSPNTGKNAISRIFELVSHIKTSEFLDHDKRNNLYHLVRDRMSEFKSDLREQRKEKIEDEINACVKSFPSKNSADAHDILNNLEHITNNIDNLSKLSGLPDKVHRHEKNINKTIDRISSDKIIETEVKKELQTLFANRIEGYELKVIRGKKKSIEQRVDEKVKSLKSDLPKEKEYEIYSKTSINYIFDEKNPTKYQELNEFEKIYRDIKKEKVFSENDVNEMRDKIKRKLNHRRREIVEQEKEEILQRAQDKREDIIRRKSVDGKENIPLQVRKISKIRDYLRGKIDQKGLPDEVRLPYLQNLRVLSERTNHGVLNSEQISQIRSKLEKDRNERIRELNKKYKQHIQRQLEEDISRLDTVLGDEYRLKVQVEKRIRNYIDTKSNSYISKSNFSDLDPKYRQIINHIIELINKSKNPDTVISQEDRNQIRGSIVHDLDEHISRAQNDLLEKQKTEFSEYLSENYSVNNDKETHKLIKELRQIKLRIQDGATAHSVPDTAIEKLKMINSNELNSSHKKEFANHFVPKIENLIEALRERIGDNLKTKIFNYLEASANSNNGYNTKMKKMQAVSDLVDPSSSANRDILDQELINNIDIMKEEKLKSIFPDVDNKAQNLIDDQLEEHSEYLYYQLVHTCKNSSSADQILDTFSHYINSHEEGSVDEINNKLSEICDEYDHARQLLELGVISEDQLNSYKSNVGRKVEQLEQEFESGNILDRVRDSWR